MQIGLEETKCHNEELFVIDECEGTEGGEHPTEDVSRQVNLTLCTADLPTHSCYCHYTARPYLLYNDYTSILYDNFCHLQPSSSVIGHALSYRGGKHG